jgi:ADP-ribose pyrophosphatase YjhB (NUDIX family)
MNAEPGAPRSLRVAAYALATHEDRILLVRMAPGYPSAGQWTLPGGGLDFGEDPAAAALRELTEETGLSGEIRSIAFVDSRTWPARPEADLGAWHAIRVVYRVEITGGELRDEIDESTDAAAWFTPEVARNGATVDLVRVALDHLDSE